ncbi:hypothetical protein CGCSCA4_v002265 [Colletotrichum siamense]|uniref:Uncharacterized protein n=1 Tax=Colletotrichum siamense TaxID=690259 RepID=A0A9P5F2E5_COLSI|nr:hypothetical protein CGCSCA4_v002265 [Colletotrichum siamense]KAF4864170.1 hypothetical protein CGCSCA2_v002400 [Colletotrichum siamense]
MKPGANCVYDDYVEARIVQESNKQSRAINKGAHKRLACPFFKQDPATNQYCIGVSYQTWAHVKQHLRRKHFLESTPGDCSPEVLHQTTCGSTGNIGLSMIGKDTLKGVEEVTRPRKLSDCERWKTAWSVIFPKVKPPASPYAQDPRTSLVEHVIQQICNRPESFDAGLVHARIVQSEEVSRAIITRLIEFLRGEASPTSPIHSVLPCTGGKEGDTMNSSGVGETDVIQYFNSEAISNDFPAAQAQWHGLKLMTTTESSNPAWDYCNSEFVDEVMKDWQEGGAGDNSL